MSEIFYPISFPTPINTNITLSESFIGKTYAEMYTANGKDRRLGFSHLFNLNGSSKISYSVASGYFIWFSAYDANGCYLGQSYALGWKRGSAEITFQPQVKQIAIFFRKGEDSVFVPNDWPNVQCKVSILCNYPDLPIVTDESGFEYAEGLNLVGQGNKVWSITKNATAPIVNSIPTTLIGDDAEKNYVLSVFNKSLGSHESSSPSAAASTKNRFGIHTAETWKRPDGSTFETYQNASLLKRYGENRRLYTPYKPMRTVENAELVSVRIFVQLYEKPTGDDAWELSDVMLTYGKKEHPYRPRPTDLVGGGLPMSIVARGLPLTVRNSIDEAIQNSAAQLEQRLSTAITQTGESIKNEVAQQYYAKGDTDRIIAEASTILEQKYNSFEMSFNSFKQMVDSNQNLTNAEFATITKFIRFIDGNIFLGEEGNNQMLKIAKDRISFLQGNQEVAYISDSTLYIYDGVFLNSLRIGNFAFVPRANGSLDFKKVR